MGKIPTQLTLGGGPETSRVTLQLQRAVTSFQFSWQCQNSLLKMGLAGGGGRSAENSQGHWERTRCL